MNSTYMASGEPKPACASLMPRKVRFSLRPAKALSTVTVAQPVCNHSLMTTGNRLFRGAFAVLFVNP